MTTINPYDYWEESLFPPKIEGRCHSEKGKKKKKKKQNDNNEVEALKNLVNDLVKKL